MTMGPLLWGWMHVASFAEKVILVSRIFRLAFLWILGKILYIQYMAGVPFVGRASLPTPSKSSCNCVKRVAHNLIALIFEWIISFPGSRASCVVLPSGVRPSWPLGGIDFDIYLEVFLLNQPYDLLIKLIAVFYIVPFNFMELIPSAWLMSRNVCLWG